MNRVLLCLNILAVVLTHLSIAIVAQQASYITGVAEPLTAIFISRLLLDLQAANRCGGPNSQILDSLSPNANGTLKFASVIGSLGTSEIPDAGNFEPDAVCSEGGEDGERYIDGSEDTPGRLESSTHA
ncbi:hypothetical protein C8Q79DRAFT_963327 [Trametes meyenii]|nr:hypothetical protein C8Q79DRAFT_963327 [Trametes meyenii]